MEKVYLVKYHYEDDDNNFYDIRVFATKEKAKEIFEELHREEIKDLYEDDIDEIEKTEDFFELFYRDLHCAISIEDKEVE